MNYEQKLKDLTEKYEQDKAKLLIERDIAAALPDFAQQYNHRIFVSSLYGHNANIKFDSPGYGSEAKSPDLDLVVRLGGVFPAVPLMLVRDGCLSFRTKAYCDNLSEEEKKRWNEESEISPFLIRIETFQKQVASIEWCAAVGGLKSTDLRAGGLGAEQSGATIVTFEIKLPLHSLQLGNLEIRYKNYMGGKRVDLCRFVPNNDKIYTIFRDDTPLAELQQVIKWGRGSDEYPNDFTLYWVNLDVKEAPTVIDLVNMLRP